MIVSQPLGERRELGIPADMQEIANFFCAPGKLEPRAGRLEGCSVREPLAFRTDVDLGIVLSGDIYNRNSTFITLEFTGKVSVTARRANLHARHDIPRSITPRSRVADSSRSMSSRSGMPMQM